MPIIERNGQPEDQTKDEKALPSGEKSNMSKAETEQIEQPKKVAVKKKTVRKKAAKTTGRRTDPAKKKASQTRRQDIPNKDSNKSEAETKPIKQSKKVAVKKKVARKKAAKTAGGQMSSAIKKKSQTKRKAIKPARPSESGQDTSAATGSEPGEVRPTQQNQPDKPLETSAGPAAAPPTFQPQTRGGTGLRGFWIKVGASAFVILAGIIGIYSFFSGDEATSGPDGAKATAGVQGDDASVTDSVVAETETAPGVVLPPAAEQLNMPGPESLGGYGNQPKTFAGAAVAVEPAGETAISEEPAGYRPELYRPLKPQQDPPPPTQPSAVSDTPRATAVPAPSNYRQPGAYTYPPAPYYRGYGGYYPY